MATNNKEATRFASQTQENRIVKKLGGHRTANSGASNFQKSDIVIPECSMSIECKTCMTEKSSMSIKKEWIEKHKQEAFANRLDNKVIAFNFYYEDKEDYYIINDTLMKFLCEKLSEEYEETVK